MIQLADVVSGKEVTISGEWFDLEQPVRGWLLESLSNDNHSIAVSLVDFKSLGFKTSRDFCNNCSSVDSIHDYGFIPRRYITENNG